MISVTITGEPDHQCLLSPASLYHANGEPSMMKSQSYNIMVYLPSQVRYIDIFVIWLQKGSQRKIGFPLLRCSMESVNNVLLRHENASCE